MAAIDLTKKLLIYHTLYRLNLSFSNIVTYCANLQEAGIFTRKNAKLYQGLTQELQSEINELLLQDMHDIEFDDWGRFGKVRQAEEKRLLDPADVLIQAKEYKHSQLRKKKARLSAQKRRKARNN